MRKALQFAEGRQQLNWYCKGSNIALDIIRGLQFLHSQSVLHRDIKSGNVLLSKDFSVAKICDIGLSHIMGDSSLSPPAAQSTFAYAAPEMLLNLKCISCWLHTMHTTFVFIKNISMRNLTLHMQLLTCCSTSGAFLVSFSLCGRIWCSLIFGHSPPLPMQTSEHSALWSLSLTLIATPPRSESDTSAGTFGFAMQPYTELAPPSAQHHVL